MPLLTAWAAKTPLPAPAMLLDASRVKERTAAAMPMLLGYTPVDVPSLPDRNKKGSLRQEQEGIPAIVTAIAAGTTLLPPFEAAGFLPGLDLAALLPHVTMIF